MEARGVVAAPAPAPALPADAAAAVPDDLPDSFFDPDRLIAAEPLRAHYFCDGCEAELWAAEPTPEAIAEKKAHLMWPEEDVERRWGQSFWHCYLHTHNTIDACPQCWERMRAQMEHRDVENDAVFDECCFCRDLDERKWNRIGRARVCDVCHPKVLPNTAEVDPNTVVVRRFAMFSTAPPAEGLEMPPGVEVYPGLLDVWTRGVATRITEVARVPPYTVLAEWTLLEPLVPETPYAQELAMPMFRDTWIGLAVKRVAPFPVASVVLKHSGGTMALVYDTYEECRAARGEWEAMRLEKPAVPRLLAGGGGPEWWQNKIDSSATFAEWLAWSQDLPFGPDPINS
jgi:hypothetical protein